MYHIQVKLFGTPEVMMNEEKVLFPFRKAEALFYYLVVNKEATRDELVNLFWGDLEESIAKKNLRNAIYKIKKIFNLEVLISPKKSIIMLNPELKINSDIQCFLKNENSVQVYGGLFLKGFLVKDGENFQEWMHIKREEYREKYVKILYEMITDPYHSDEDFIDIYGRKLIEADEFDERVYRILMKHYKEKGACNKAIALYNKLKDSLKKELGVSPENETIALYHDIVMMRRRPQEARKKDKQLFFGRDRELKGLHYVYNVFNKLGGARGVLIQGEAGIGKTTLKETFLRQLQQQDVYLLEANCYQAEKEYLLKPWNPVFAKIADIIIDNKIDLPDMWINSIAVLFPAFAKLNNTKINPFEEKEEVHQYQLAAEIIVEVLYMITRKNRIVLVLEDLQWMDDISWQLLKSILQSKRGINIFFIGTCREGYQYLLNERLGHLIKEDKLDKIRLNRFTSSETKEFIEISLPNLSISNERLNEIFEDTEGNTFFLVEYINSIRDNITVGKMSSKSQDILKSRFIDVTKEEFKILNLLSLFFHHVPIDILWGITGKDAADIMDLLEELQKKGIIKEIIESEKISVEFTHNRLREYIYTQQSLARRKLLHNQVGKVLESRLKYNQGDRLLYSTLAYHFRKAGNYETALKYSIKNLNTYLDYCHELFPTIIDLPQEPDSVFAISDQQIVKYFETIEEMMLKDNNTIEELELINCKQAFLHMKGRYLIRQGEYKVGIQYIKQLLKLAEDYSNSEYALKGYLQMIYYSIQTYQTELMEKYIELAETIAIEEKHLDIKGVLIRLSGLSKIMMGEYKEAKKQMIKSIHYFTKNKGVSHKYSINIAACYNYLGEIKRCEKKFSSALYYYDKAIKICKENKVYRSLGFFSTCAGQAALDMENYTMALNFFNQSIKCYNEYDLAWRRSVAEGYLALVKIKIGELSTVEEHLKYAEEYASKMKSPYEYGLIMRVKAEIKYKMKEDNELKQILKKKLDKSVADYCSKGLSFLQVLKNCYETEILQALAKKDI